MNEFIEELIGRLGEQQAEAENEMHRLLSGDYTLPCSYDITDIKEIASESFKESIQIVNELAEEYNNTSTDTLSGWIPCSERLPEVATCYLVTEEVTVNSKKQYVTDIRLFGTEDEWLCPSNRKIIAWQPLPQPYKENENEN